MDALVQRAREQMVIPQLLEEILDGLERLLARHADFYVYLVLTGEIEEGECP